MPTVSNNLLMAVRRKRGELNMSVASLSVATGVSRWTLYKVLNGERGQVRTSTAEKLNQWLYQQI